MGNNFNSRSNLNKWKSSHPMKHKTGKKKRWANSDWSVLADRLNENKLVVKWHIKWLWSFFLLKIKLTLYHIVSVFDDGGLVTKSCPAFATLWTVACQVPLPMGFSRQEYWSGWPCPSPGDLPDSGTVWWASFPRPHVMRHWWPQMSLELPGRSCWAPLVSRAPQKTWVRPGSTLGVEVRQGSDTWCASAAGTFCGATRAFSRWASSPHHRERWSEA